VKTPVQHEHLQRDSLALIALQLLNPRMQPQAPSCTRRPIQAVMHLAIPGSLSIVVHASDMLLLPSVRPKNPLFFLSI